MANENSSVKLLQSLKKAASSLQVAHAEVENRIQLCQAVIVRNREVLQWINDVTTPPEALDKVTPSR
jgi:hypothetical protein